MKTSDVIQLGINHPSYLTQYAHLCNVIRFCDELEEVDTAKALRAIREATGNMTLLHALWEHGLLKPEQKQTDPEYKTLAMQFWEGLIEQLREQGD